MGAAGINNIIIVYRRYCSFLIQYSMYTNDAKQKHVLSDNLCVSVKASSFSQSSFQEDYF